MTNATNPAHPTAATAQAVATKLTAQVPPFSKTGFAEFQDRVAQYIATLFDESLNTAQRHGVDEVSQVHVEQASRYLVAGKPRRVWHVLAIIGGVCLGAAIENVPGMMAKPEIASMEAQVNLALGVVGAFLIAISWARE